MAWQTPKMDWAAEDGVRADDFNRIEGNIQHLKDTAVPYLSRNITYYVAPTGSDENSGLSASAPLASVQAAIDKIPKNLNGYSGNIVLAAGTYSGAVLENFYGGAITISNRNNGAVTLSGGLSVLSCTRVYVTDLVSLTVQGGFLIENCPWFEADAPIVVNINTYDALQVAYANVLLSKAIITTGNRYAAVLVDAGGKLHINDVTINSPTATGLFANAGGTISYSAIVNNASVKAFTRNGGRIFAGAQQNAPVY